MVSLALQKIKATTGFISFSSAVSDIPTQLMDVKTARMIKVHNICELNEGVCCSLGWSPNPPKLVPPYRDLWPQLTGDLISNCNCAGQARYPGNN